MQTKCGNLIPLLDIPLYIDSDHLNVLPFSLNEKKKPTQTKKNPTWCLLGPQQETYLLKQKARKKVTSLAYLHPSELSAVWQVLFCPFPVLHKPCQPCYS